MVARAPAADPQQAAKNRKIGSNSSPLCERENTIESTVELGSADTQCRSAVRDKSGLQTVGLRPDDMLDPYLETKAVVQSTGSRLPTPSGCSAPDASARSRRLGGKPWIGTVANAILVGLFIQALRGISSLGGATNRIGALSRRAMPRSVPVPR